MREEITELVDRLREKDTIAADILEHMYLTNAEAVELSKNGRGLVRRAIAFRKNLPHLAIANLCDGVINDATGDVDDIYVREIIADREKLAPIFVEQLAHDRYPYIRKLIAERWRLSSKIIKQLAEDSDQKVRAVIARNAFTLPKILGQLAKDPEWNVKARLWQQRNREGNQIYLPVEINFALFSGLVGFSSLAAEESLNQKLARELKEIMGKDLIKPGDQIKVGLARKKFIFYGNNIIAWRRGKEKKWTVGIMASERSKVDKKKDHYTLTNVRLPEAVDGFFNGFFGKDDRLYLGGAVKEKTNKQVYFWEVTGEDKPLGQNSIPDFKARYPKEEQRLNKGPLDVELAGQLIINFGLYSLWAYQGEPIGWTEENNANHKQKREIQRKNLVKGVRALSSKVLEDRVRLIFKDTLTL